MPRSTLTSKGQVTIPKAVRDRLGLRPGDRLEFSIESDGTMTVEPLGPDGEERPLAGYLNDHIPAGKSLTVEQLDRSMREHVAREVISSLRAPGVGGDDDRA
ncbi:MAG: AbrB/MazE/SpoVT family DNA-binding domain-containing protein [Gemmatimonadota bacterium]